MKGVFIMANVMFKLSLPVYARVAQTLSRTAGESSAANDVLEAFTREACIVNEDDIAPEDAVVQVKINSDYVGIIFEYCLDLVNTDGKFADGNGNPESVLSSKYAKDLFDIYKWRIAKKAAEKQQQAEYIEWLYSCFDKYVIDMMTPSCKEIAAAINKDESSAKYGHIKYQNIMRPLKDYRARKFGNKADA